MRKRIFSVAMALCMVLGLLPVTAWAEVDNSVSEVYIGGTAESGGVKLDNDTPYYHNGENGGKGTADRNSNNANATFVNGTLTLNELKIITNDYGIQWKHTDPNCPLTIVLNGTNTVENTTGAAICGNNQDNNDGTSLVIQGNGTLNATGSTSGIWVWRNITIQGSATVNATGQSSVGIANNSGYGVATITIKDDAKVTAIGGETGETYGIGYTNENGENNLYVISNNAVVVAKGNTAAFMKAPDLDGYTGSLTDKKWASTEYSDGTFEAYNASNIGGYKYVIFGEDAPTPAAHTHCVCGDDSCSDTGHNADQTWTAWNGTSDIAYTGNVASVYISVDEIQLTDTLTVANGKTLNLCLNGKTLKGASGKDTIKVETGGTLNLTDCKTGDAQGAITHADGKTGKGLNNEGTVIMYGGKITGNKTQISDHSGGAGVKNGLDENVSARFTMYGGEISNNNSTNHNGGGVDSNGTFTMYGGSIKNNTASGSGGGVYINSGTFNMNGGSVTNNTATGNGGGVYYHGGTFKVSGDVNISGNTTGGNANNVYLPSGKTITIAGELTGSGTIGVTTEVTPPVEITEAYATADYSSKIVSDNTAYETFRDTDNVIKLKARTASTYTVSFNAGEGGSGSMDAVTGVGGTYTLPANGFTAPAGKQFAGWSVPGMEGTQAAGTEITVNGDITVTAVWKYIPFTFNASTTSMSGAGTVTFTVIPETNYSTAGSGLNVTCSDTTYNPTYDTTSGTWSVSLPNTTKTYTFTAKYADDDVQTKTCTVSVTESVAPTYKVTFVANGGSSIMDDVTGVAGTYELPANGFTAPAGKKFKAWSVGATEYHAGDIITVSANTTVTAIWEYIPITITPSTDYMRGKGTVTLTVAPYDENAGLGVTCNDSSITVTDNPDGTYSAYLPNRTQSYTFTAKYSGDTLDTVTVGCTVDVRKKSSSSSVEEEKPAEKPEEKPAEKPEEKPDEKPEEVSKNNEIVLTIGQRAAVVFGDPVVNDVAPVIRSDRAMLPIRFVVEALGGTVTWNQAQQSVTCVKGDSTITIYIGHPFALVNGNPVELDAPAFIENDRTYLPIRFVAENLDAAVTWDADTQEVTVVPNQ